ncbi:MAG: hypothetical protein U0176_06030 [Bacteroidia bacterium]
MKTPRFTRPLWVAAMLLQWASTTAIAQGNSMWRTNGNANASTQFVGTTDQSPLILKTANAERLRIQPSGDMKVSALSGSGPAVLAVKPDGSLYRLDNPGTDTAFSCATRLYSADGNWLTPNCRIGSLNAAPVRIISNGTERIRVTESGNVGIGTTTPQAPLHVQSSTNAELRIQGTTVAAQPQLGLAVGSGPVTVKLASLSAGLSPNLDAEAHLSINDGSGPATMRKVITMDRNRTHIHTRLGIGMEAPANDFAGINGSLILTDQGNQGNYIRIGHNGTAAFIEHRTGTANSNGSDRLLINGGGGRTDFGGLVVANDRLGIGTTNFTDNATGKDYRLSVDGRIRCTEIKIYSGWADHVFSPDYKLLPLSEVETYIATNGHLPGLPSAAEVEQNGVDVGETQALLLEKIEELTLHLIRLERENVELRTMIKAAK